MLDAISRLMVCLVLLGFLAATAMNMYGDLQQLKSDNQQLTSEITRLRSTSEALVQERDSLKAQNVDLSVKLDAIQKVYVLENQARIKAESEAASYKNTQIPSICAQAEQQASYSGTILASNIVPLGAGSLVTLSIAVLLLRINYHQKQSK